MELQWSVDSGRRDGKAPRGGQNAGGLRASFGEFDRMLGPEGPESPRFGLHPNFAGIC